MQRHGSSAHSIGGPIRRVALSARIAPANRLNEITRDSVTLARKIEWTYAKFNRRLQVAQILPEDLITGEENYGRFIQ